MCSVGESDLGLVLVFQFSTESKIKSLFYLEKSMLYLFSPKGMSSSRLHWRSTVCQE